MADHHWAAPLIGKPYRELARGPDAFDCWGVNQYAWKELAGLDVPDVRLDAPRAFRSVMETGRCSAGSIEAFEVKRPRELDAVYLTCRTHPHHVGLWIEPDPIGGVLHAIEGAGVVFQRRADLTAHGYSIVKFMRLRAAG